MKKQKMAWSLVIDIGNSFCKFAFIDTHLLDAAKSSAFFGLDEALWSELNRELGQVQSVSHQNENYLENFLDVLHSERQWASISSVLIVWVKSQENKGLAILNSLKKRQTQLIVHEAKSQRSIELHGHKLVNGYQNHSQLGKDRWLALIAGSFICQNQNIPASNIAVLDFGSVISLDFIEQKKQDQMDFVGGLLIANLDTIQSALAIKMPLQSTRSTEKQPVETTLDFLGQSTQKCITAGFNQSLMAMMKTHPMMVKSEQIFVTGGGYQPFLPHLLEAYPNTIEQKNMVLLGLVLQYIHDLEPK